ncbi:MAG: SLC13 family permease, partial [Proteobacteria bacterium]|nr:SLC13 family permease [Pseudomonadota bacterium]
MHGTGGTPGHGKPTRGELGITVDQIFVLGLLAVVLVFFVWGKFRYDVVAFSALIAAVLAGVVVPNDAFLGFGHPATVTVGMVLIISRGLVNSGAVQLMTKHLIPPLGSTTAHVGLLAGVGGTLSAVMNNVGALALLMPAALQSAKKAKRAAALLLMPLAFGSILGGLVTLIGTPPNIIVATFRESSAGEPFGMFDFTPVGIVIAIAGILFVSLVGWRLIPAARSEGGAAEPLFEIENYVAELRVPEVGESIGELLRDVEAVVAEHEGIVLGLIRRGHRIDRPRGTDKLEQDDRLIVETGSEGLDGILKALDLKPAEADVSSTDLMESSELSVIEAVIQPGSRMIGRTALSLRLRGRHGVVLLAVSRQGRPRGDRLNRFRFQAGDVLLLADDAGRVAEIAVDLGCLPLAERETGLGGGGRAWLSIGIFIAAIVLPSIRLLTIPIALSLAAGGMVLLNIVPPRQIYD